MLSRVAGYVNESSMINIASSVISRPFGGPITLLNEFSFLIVLKSRENVKEVCKLGSFNVSMKDDPCTLMLSPWSMDLVPMGRHVGEGNGLLSGTYHCMLGVRKSSPKC